ncbi:Transposase family tnp2 [Rhizoctonia solani]|uniref:Transposase family tnp2 n=1 Tax=Rhizoctonia solani TaxID=456999 RepID=A0A8H7I4J1_9AGAM|nr:Transposase family tnp2 [Rhizoctonia solani]
MSAIARRFPGSGVLDKDSGRNNDININDDSPPGDSQTGEQGNEDANMTGAPDSQTKSNDNDIAHQLAGQEFSHGRSTTQSAIIHTPKAIHWTMMTVWTTRAAAGTGHTPSPSPPLPPPKHESSLSEPNNDGFQSVDAKDYWEYKQWTRIAALSSVEPENIDCCLNPGEMHDFFDSSWYDKLLHTNIVIDGNNTGVPHFPGKHNIALAIMTDGVQIFDQEEQAQMRNLILLGVIPGPNKPKDFDLFLVPLVNKFIKLAKGIKVYNTMNGKTITLRIHPTIISGNMQAIKYLMNFKGEENVLYTSGQAALR